MTKDEYLKYGKAYLKLKGFKEQLSFDEKIKKKFPIAKYRVFKKWIGDVNLHESHRNTKNTEDYYMKRLEFWLSPNKNKK